MSNTSSTSRGGYPGGTKIYRALLTQSGSNAPVATVLTNTFGGVIRWSRHGAGDYRGVIPGVFRAAKTFLMINAGSVVDEGGGQTAWLNRISDDSVKVLTTIDDELINTPIEIIVYP